MYFGGNFILQKICMCKKNDKYEVCKKLCNDIVNPTDLWSSISLISETGSLKVTLSGRVPGNIKSIPPINCGHKGPTFRARKSHFVTKRKFLYKLGSLNSSKWHFNWCIVFWFLFLGSWFLVNSWSNDFKAKTEI